MTELFTLAAQVMLSRRLKNLLRIDEDIEIDTNYISCAEYQLFINAKREIGENFQPDHWTSKHFPIGEAKKPITGIRNADAEAFCHWLTQQSAVPGFRYRLPTLAEAQKVEVLNYPTSDGRIGYWCRDGDIKDVANIDLESWQGWHNKLAKLFGHNLRLDLVRARVLDDSGNYAFERTLNLALVLDSTLAFNRALNLARGRISDLALDLALDLARTLDLHQDAYHIFVSYRTHNRDIGRAFNRSHDLKIYTNHSRALDVARTRAHALTLALDRARAGEEVKLLNSVRTNMTDHELDRSRFQSHALNEVIDHALDHVLGHIRKPKNAHQDFGTLENYSLIRYYLLLISVQWILLKDFYIRASKNQSVLRAIKLTFKASEDSSRACIAEANRVFSLYVFFLIIELRRNGQMPAWEGIRIVRERIG